MSYVHSKSIKNDHWLPLETKSDERWGQAASNLQCFFFPGKCPNFFSPNEFSHCDSLLLSQKAASGNHRVRRTGSSKALSVSSTSHLIKCAATNAVAKCCPPRSHTCSVDRVQRVSCEDAPLSHKLEIEKVKGSVNALRNGGSRPRASKIFSSQPQLHSTAYKTMVPELRIP